MPVIFFQILFKYLIGLLNLMILAENAVLHKQTWKIESKHVVAK